MARRGFVSGKIGPIDDPFVGKVYEVELAVNNGATRWTSRQIEPLHGLHRIPPGGFLFRSAARSLEEAIRESGEVDLLVGRNHA